MPAVTESKLSAYMKCSLMDPAADPFWDSLQRPVRDIVRLASDMRISSLQGIRALMSESWTKQKPAVPEAVYLKGHKAIPGVARRLSDFIRDYRIMVPPIMVKLDLEQGTIVVDYSVAVPFRKDGPWFCVNLVRSKSPIYSAYPDAVSLARWLDLQTRERFKDIHILNLPLLAGRPWITRDLSKPLVRRQLAAILTTIESGISIYRPGPHCESCATRRCQEQIYGR